MAVLTALLYTSLLALNAAAGPIPSALTSLQGRAGNNGLTATVDNGSMAPKIDSDFPDPSLLQGPDGKWYSFATNGNGKHIQVARADAVLGDWELLDGDALPDKAWTSGNNFWAPDVRRVDDGFVMYFSGERPEGRKHCVGIARSQDIAGPYTPDAQPWACHLDQGGAIDASGFEDPASGRRFVVYKIDGSSIGHGGDCNNGVAPVVDTPIMLQEVDRGDGASKRGAPQAILHRTDADGPLVEAPNLVSAGGRYVLFFSSHCFTSTQYDVKYAFADAVDGPYTRGGEQMLKAGSYGLDGPGGMTSTEGGGEMVFHGWCNEEHTKRCMYAASYSLH